jgi:hypothetical protein
VILRDTIITAAPHYLEVAIVITTLIKKKTSVLSVIFRDIIITAPPRYLKVAIVIQIGKGPSVLGVSCLVV